jgi:transcriptional regulator with XRE-family HTH domain
MPRKHKYEPHLQLKTIRKKLGKTQKQLAEMLGVSYPYLLSVETGQRDMSEPLARKISWLFGLSSPIRNKKATPMSWDHVSKKLVPFSAETFRKHASQPPTFRIETDDTADTPDRVTPTLKGYTKAFHALLDSAAKTGRLGAVLESFFTLFAENIPSDAAIDAFQASYRKLHPHDSGDAQRALVGYIYDIVRTKIEERDFSRSGKRKRRRKRKRI